MTESVILPDNFATIDEHTDLTLRPIEPSSSTLAGDIVLGMLGDSDVLALSSEIRASLKRFALEIADSIKWNPSIRIALFGDPDTGLGEITVMDRLNRREMQVSVGSDFKGTFWLRGDRDRVLVNNLPIDSVPLVVTRFELL